jgi:NAD(P)-dependent dehydrogenase (short-subunit alcohol dehydrogenase family)
MAGRIAIVISAYAGLALETTKALRSAGTTVIAAAQTVEKAAANLAALSVETAHSNFPRGFPQQC